MCLDQGWQWCWQAVRTCQHMEKAEEGKKSCWHCVRSSTHLCLKDSSPTPDFSETRANTRLFLFKFWFMSLVTKSLGRPKRKYLRGEMGNFMQNNCELGLAGRTGICQEDVVILKDALAPGFINQKQNTMRRVKHFLNSKRIWESSVTH